MNRFPMYGLLSLSATLLSGDCHAYDRNEAVAYARAYTDNSGGMDGVVWNSSGPYVVYKNSNRPPGVVDWSDCANYMSQCLIAGGVRFRSSKDQNDNVKPGRLPELGTLEATEPINSTDKIQYSRVFPGVAAFGRSLLKDPPKRHGGVKYLYEDLRAAGTEWTAVKIGDLLMQVDTVGGWDHAMMITGFAMDGTFKTYEYCAHSRWRKDYSYGMTDAGVRGITRLIRLPDAPLIKQVSFWAGSVSSASALNWLYRKKWANLSANKHAGAGRLVVEVLFDAGMKANVVPTVQLTIPSTGTTSNTLNFLPDSAGDFNEFGWYIGAVTGNAKPYRTWRGYINALPSGRNVIGAVSIKAYGADGSATDSSNLLDEYSPGAVSMFYAIKIDTRKSQAKQNSRTCAASVCCKPSHRRSLPLSSYGVVLVADTVFGAFSLVFAIIARSASAGYA